ncbi:energy coupling factor transporter S component ThiW [Anaerosphaera multitolerans]|uniref:Energy coupling factor transporter S component ThiW n=2 Tax=Anaerosphaera multitolerans TaxID=2487351 RepID=A0A437S938_9FIRM|nr:energy coupling factor transporter S component ThiW [Anaerosphaera multitolerans]
MGNKIKNRRLTVASLLIALGFVLSPILRVPGMAPMQHFINVICSVLLGPWYSLVCAFLIALLRMMLLGVNLLAVTGGIFGAVLSGIFYRRTGKLIAATIGEMIGTGIIGAIASWPVMKYIYGAHEVVWLTYLPSFIMGTLIGGGLGLLFLVALKKRNLLEDIQRKLGTYSEKNNL